MRTLAELNYVDYEARERRRIEFRLEAQQRKEKEKRELQEKIDSYKYPFNHPIPEHIRIKLAKIEIVKANRDEHNKNNPQWKRWGISKKEFELLGKTLSLGHCQSVYIMDKDLNIVDWVESKNDLCDIPFKDDNGEIMGSIGGWITNNTPFKKGTGRTLIWSYIKERKLYKDSYYFVPVKEYEQFMKEKR